MKKIFRIFAILFGFSMFVYFGYMAYIAFNGHYISSETKNLSIILAGVLIVVNLINALWAQKK